jgi:hypothetical protein
MMNGLIKLPAILAKNVTTNALVSMMFVVYIISIFYSHVMFRCTTSIRERERTAS